MKTASTELWQLINTLTAAEKTYFKRNFTALAKKEELIYLKLFNKIATQKIYDEEKIITDLKGKINLKNISSQKTYLFKQITSALINYHSKGTEQDIYQQILLIRLYRSKGLINLAHKAWQKAMTAARNESAYSMLTILKSEYEKMALFNSEQTSYEESYFLFKNKENSYENFISILQLRDIYAEVLQLKAKAHFDISSQHKEKISQIEEQLSSMDQMVFNNSFWPLHYYTICLGTLQYLSNKHKNAISTLQKTHTLWKSNPKLITSNAEFFIELINMINYAGIACGNFNYVQKVLEDPVNLNIKGATNIANFKTIQWLTLSKIYHKTANYKKVEELVEVLNREYNNWVPLLNSELNRTLHVSISISCFVLERYNDAYSYCKRSLDIYRKNVREESSAFAHLFLLLITYEMNNMKLFDSTQINTHAYFYKKKKQHPFEKVMYMCLSKSFHVTGYKMKKGFYESSLAELQIMMDSSVQRAAFNIFNYPRWLASKIEKMPYRKYVEGIIASEVRSD